MMRPVRVSAHFGALSDRSLLIRMQMVGSVKQNGRPLDWPVLDEAAPEAEVSVAGVCEPEDALNKRERS